MLRAGPAARIRYWFDSIIARGAWVLLLWMLGAALLAVVIIALLAAALGVEPDPEGPPMSFAEMVWVTLMHAIDPGTITGNEGVVAWRAIMLGATVAGILMIGGVVGIMVAGVESLFHNLRKGRSLVLEDDHTLVVGWSRQVFTIVSEIAKANESRGHGCVVVLADRDKVEMEDELRAKVGPTGATRVVVRTGDPTDPGALDVVNPGTSRAIIVLAADDAKRDTQTIRALLAVGKHEMTEGRSQHVVAELRDPRNKAAAQLTGKRRLETLAVGELVAKLSVQTCLQSGLSVIYEELLGFDGDEIYFHEQRELVGSTFQTICHAFSDASPIGLVSPDGKVTLNPPPETELAEGGKVVVIAADDDQVTYDPEPNAVDQDAIVMGDPAAGKARRTLVLGWGDGGLAIVEGIDAYVAAGSRIEIVSDDPRAKAQIDALRPKLRHTEIQVQLGDVTDRTLLDRLAESSFDHVLLLADERLADPHEADARSLVTLLHLRDIASHTGQRFSVVSEMRDLRNRDLADAARADDFIISDRILGLLLAQTAENADVCGVFNELFDPEGSEIYLRPASAYVQLDREIDFHVLVESAARRGETALGYRISPLASDAARDFGVVLNPRKHQRFRLGQEDRVIVLAHD